MKNIKSYQLIHILFILFGFMACEQVPDCNLEKTDSILKVRLFDKELLTEEKVKYDSIKSINSDSLFFTSNDSLSLYSLDLNGTQNTTTFIFYSELKTDSLIISYDNVYAIPFEECDPIIDISNILISKSTFDSTVLIFDFLNLNIPENIEIYQ